MSFTDGARKQGRTIFFVLTCFLACFVAAMLATMGIVGVGAYMGWSSYATMVAAQSIGTIISFGVPAFASARTVYGSRRALFGGNAGTTWLMAAAAVAALAVAQPLVMWCSFVNEQLCLMPAFYSETMWQMNEQVNKQAANLIVFDTPMHSVFTVVVVALLPAVCEELFFRGTLQKAIESTSKNVAIAVISSALIFSMLHGQALAFFPRFVLGVVLGLVYAYGRNIWLPMAAHFVNNLAVIIMLVVSDEPVAAQMSQPTDNPGALLPVLSLMATAGILKFMHGKQPKPQNDGSAQQSFS